MRRKNGIWNVTGEMMMTKSVTPQDNTDAEFETKLERLLDFFTEPSDQEKYLKDLQRDIVTLFHQYRDEAVAKTEAAYGGCHKCYGKGYATVNGRWSGWDTDTDIGSPGGKVSGGDPSEMKFCVCDRGKQLKEQTNKTGDTNEP